MVDWPQASTHYVVRVILEWERAQERRGIVITLHAGHNGSPKTCEHPVCVAAREAADGKPRGS
jgi:hypothetical protein